MLEIIGSGILGALLGTVVGSLVTYYTQKYTQERAWKREYILKSVETVHGPMFVGVSRILSQLEKPPCYQITIFQWSEIQDSYHYLMIEKEFRKKMENFFTKLEDHNKAIRRAHGDVLPNILVEEIQHEFASYKIDRVPQFLVKTPSNEYESLIDPLFLQKHPMDYVAEKFPKLTNPEYYIVFYQNGKAVDLKYSDSSKRKFDKVWKLCHERAEKDLTIKSIRREHDELIHEAQELREELIKRIEGQWKI